MRRMIDAIAPLNATKAPDPAPQCADYFLDSPDMITVAPDIVESERHIEASSE